MVSESVENSVKQFNFIFGHILNPSKTEDAFK